MYNASSLTLYETKKVKGDEENQPLEKISNDLKKKSKKICNKDTKKKAKLKLHSVGYLLQQRANIIL